MSSVSTAKESGLFKARVPMGKARFGYIELLWKSLIILIEMMSIGKSLDRAYSQFIIMTFVWKMKIYRYTYSTGGSSCAVSHSVQYRFWWRKVGGSWTSTRQSSLAGITLNYHEEGTYEIDTQTQCAHDNSLTSGHSDILTVVIEDDAALSPKATLIYPRMAEPVTGEMIQFRWNAAKGATM